MHETFQIIKPYLKEHDFTINGIRDSIPKDCKAVVRKVQTIGRHLILETQGVSIFVWGRSSSRQRYMLFDLYDPESLSNMVEYMRFCLSKPSRCYLS